MLEPRSVINECYILQERIGRDSYCELWRATALYTATPLLLRFLDDTPALAKIQEKFRSAALRCYRVADPAVADFIEVERFGDRLFIASEYTGELPMTLALRPGTQFGLEHVCRFVMELARGLDAFHGQGIPYGCLNPENVLFHRDAGVVRGLRVQKPGYMSLLPALDTEDVDAVLETYGYLAPEAKAGGEPDERSDVYCLGVHLVRLLTGNLPLPRDARKVRERSVSLEYVANALTRRSVPEAVIRVALRALRRNPAHRYPACVDLMAELRVFVDERRREYLRNGGADPLAELEALNRGFARHGQAAEAVRSLDTADYFRALSESAPEPVRHESGPGFPVQDFKDPAEVGRIEAREIDGAQDDGSLSIDEILERSRRLVSQERGSRRLSLASTAVKNEAVAPSASAGVASAESPKKSDGPEDGRPLSEEYVPDFPAARPEAPAPKAASPRKAAAPGKREGSGVHWSHLMVPPEDVARELGLAFRAAFRGRGTFRFIQEPRDGASAGLFAELFSRFRYEGFFVDAGLPKPDSPIGVRTDVTDFIRAARASIARTLLGEPPGSVRYLRRRVAEADRFRAFRAPPLDRVLFGAAGEEPDPDDIEAREGLQSLADTLLALGRRSRPLVFVFRGGERIDRALHNLLIRLARGAAGAPACVFIFYDSADVEPWHALSRLKHDS